MIYTLKFAIESVFNFILYKIIFLIIFRLNYIKKFYFECNYLYLVGHYLIYFFKLYKYFYKKLPNPILAWFTKNMTISSGINMSRKSIICI